MTTSTMTPAPPLSPPLLASQWVKPVTLELAPEDEHRLGPGAVRLMPLLHEHAPALWDSIGGADGAAEVLRYHVGPVPRTLEDMRANVAERLHMQAHGVLNMPLVAFAITLKDSAKPIGITTYLDIQDKNRGLEIGFTWIGPAWQRTRVNTECKYLLLRHAFEALGPSPVALPALGYPETGAIRVQLKGDGRNTRSLNAVKRLGAVHEGTLRAVRILYDAHVRDTWYCSILRHEWDTRVKAHIEGLLTAK